MYTDVDLKGMKIPFPHFYLSSFPFHPSSVHNSPFIHLHPHLFLSSTLFHHLQLPLTIVSPRVHHLLSFPAPQPCLSLSNRSAFLPPLLSPLVPGSIHTPGLWQAFGPQQSGFRALSFSPCPISPDLLSVNRARAEFSGCSH